MSSTDVHGNPRIRVAIIGAGIGGLATANGLVNDPDQRFDVTVYERSLPDFSSEQGGYQLRIASAGLQGLKDICSKRTWALLQKAWAGDDATAPTMVNPKNFNVEWVLHETKLYPQSRPVPRAGLRSVLMDSLLKEERVRFDCAFKKFEVVANADNKGNHEVVCHFENPEKNPSITADILIASDGSRSTVNGLVGLNNKIKVQGWTLIQSQANVDEKLRSQLPQSMLKHGSVMLLGGATCTGFASVYDYFLNVEDAEHGKTQSKVFWAVLIPQTLGRDLMTKSGGDDVKLCNLVADYLVNDLKYDPKCLPFIINNATQQVRTGGVTSSRRPPKDWRDGEDSLSRIVLLGDAVHPMTPGRGMGANQTIIDAASLVKTLRQREFAKPDGLSTDKNWADAVKIFEAEMMPRAFKMVKASEDMTALDLTALGDRLKIRFAKTILTVAGWFVSALEMLHLKKRERFDLDY